MKKLYFSRKFHLTGIFTLLLLFVGFSIAAQQLIAEPNSATLNDHTNLKFNSDKNNYTQLLEENGSQLFLKNQSPIQGMRQRENTMANIILTMNFVFDENQFYVTSVLIYDESGYLHTTTDQNFTNPLVVSLPNGTYDIVTKFKALTSGTSHDHYVLKEQQNIQTNTTVQINTADANNYVAITAYDENGDILLDIEGGSISFQRFFYFNPINKVTTSDFLNEDEPVGGADPDHNFYINDVSSRYSIIQSLKTISISHANYYTKFQTLTGIDNSVSLQNDPTAWSYHEENFQPTKVALSEVFQAHFVASTFNGILLVGWMESAGGLIAPGDADFRGFINNPLDGDPVDLIVIPAIIDRFVPFSPTTGGIDYFTKGNPVFSDGNGGVIYGSGDVSQAGAFPSDDYYVVSNGDVQLLPLNPRFSFDDTTTPSAVQGNNVPIIVTNFRATPNSFNSIYRGRYGETRESDYLATHIVVKQNGSIVFSGSYEDFTTFHFPSGGQFEIVLTNGNTLMEGLQGLNTTSITYNADQNDVPPTLQHLQFRDADDQVTSVFDSGQGATVRLAAGDFVYHAIGGSRGYYSYKEGSNVSLSYSIHNENNWTELGLTKDPTYFQMPGFGDYYEASLTGIGSQNSNVWYDVKVICIDTDGNKQEQIISPAFKINEPLSIQDIAMSNFAVYPNPFSEQLNIILPQNVMGNYTLKVMDLSGRTVYARNQSDKSFSWDGSFLSQGVYILSIENNGTAITKKVIKI
ncbi:MAG: T9SS type A sorting domain-containing protein [Aequorivita sp.]